MEMKSDQKSARLGCLSAIGGDLWADEIFKRLPIKSLGRCRCVCKGWNSLISSSLCIATHHSFTFPATSTAPKTFLHLHRGSCTLYHSPQPLPLSFPFRFRDIATPSKLNYELVDVINGVVCVYHSLLSSFDSAILWNPAICRYVALPSLPLEMNKETKKKKALDIRTSTLFSRNTRASHFRPNAIGFGYQSSKNDFKVVRVWITSSSSYKPPRYEVYSSRQGLWREAKANTNAFAGLKSCGFLNPATSCFLNGTIHWLLSTSNDVVPKAGTYSLLLLMFDCEQEEFRTMELPEEVSLFQTAIFHHRPESRVRTRLLKYSGMLSVLLCFKEEPRFELWAMTAHGVASTWNKLVICEDGYNLSNGYVYEETMFLMDNVKGGKYYAKGEAVDIQLHPRTRGEKRWRCPPVNWIKLNTHGAFRGDNHLGGAGGVFRDHEGRFVQAFSLKMEDKPAFEAQLRAMWTGLQMAQSMGIRSLIVETDSIEVVQAVTTSNYVTKPLGSDIQMIPCEEFIEGWPWRVGVCYAPAESNKVAHWFAKSGITQDEWYVLFKDVPDEVEQFIANDVCETTTN